MKKDGGSGAHEAGKTTMAAGDHLYYYRSGSLYSHHGICCGDGTVVHYESSLWLKLAGTWLDPQIAEPTVRRVTLEEFAQGKAVIVRDYSQCDDPQTVVQRALSRLGESDYDLWENNCEHFAVWCKTGRARSMQVEAARQASKMILCGTAVGILLWSRVKRES
jgi:hypothetical protein